MKLAKYFLTALATLLWVSCSDDRVPSEDFDIRFPIPVLDSITPAKQTVGQNITIHGKNFNRISNVAINGVYACKVVLVDTLTENKHKIVVTVPRVVETGVIHVTNLYRVETVSSFKFTPQFLDVAVSMWPPKIEKGKTFKILGTNMDMIKSVSVNGKVVTIQSADATTAVVSISSLTDVNIGDMVTVSIVGKSDAAVADSPPIPIVEPSKHFSPVNGYLLFDFETNATGEAGAGGTHTTGYNLNGVKSVGRCFSVTAPFSNAWNGIFYTLKANNGNNGYDLSSFHDPCLTFLINTNNQKGYFSFGVAQGGVSKGDKHFTSALGYDSDSYLFTTAANGWEWRSYRLSEFGFSGVDWMGRIDEFSFLFRGGNVPTTAPFEIHIDQVMITDGKVNTVAVMDFETGGVPSFPNPSGIGSGGSAVTGLNLGTGVNIGSGFQGDKYFTVKGNDGRNGEYGSIISPNQISLSDFDINYNGLYYNFLVNSGTGGYGYYQLVIRQSGRWTLKHFYGSQNYADWSLMTAGKWQWRSYSLNPRNQSWDWTSAGASGVEIDFSQPFEVELSYKGNGTSPFELNVDYIYFSAAPLSPTDYTNN